MTTYRNGYRHPAIVAAAIATSPVVFPAIAIVNAVVDDLIPSFRTLPDAARFVGEEATKGVKAIGRKLRGLFLDHVADRLTATIVTVISPALIVYSAFVILRDDGFFQDLGGVYRDLFGTIVSGKRDWLVL